MKAWRHVVVLCACGVAGTLAVGGFQGPEDPTRPPPAVAPGPRRAAVWLGSPPGGALDPGARGCRPKDAGGRHRAGRRCPAPLHARHGSRRDARVRPVHGRRPEKLLGERSRRDPHDRPVGRARDLGHRRCPGGRGIRCWGHSPAGPKRCRFQAASKYR